MSLPRRVADINPAAFTGSSPGFLVAVGNTLFFRASQTLSDSELWKSDGTSAGTVRVADINPGPAGSRPIGPSSRGVAVGNTLYFGASNGINGYELWKSDGSNAGTTRVANLNPGIANASPFNLTVVGNTLFFWSGLQLWKTDGVTASRFADFSPNGGFSIPQKPTAFGGSLFLRVNNSINVGSLWKTNGVVTTRIDIRSAPYGSSPSPLVAVGSTLFYAADDGTTGSELWKTDGTTSTLVADILTGSRFASSSPAYLTAVGNTLFFTAEDGIAGRELWKSDGTSPGTMRVADIKPGRSSSDPADFTVLGSTLYFTANDGSTGREIWKSDGITTTRVANINPDSSSPSQANPSNLTVVGNMLYFTANDGTEDRSGSELWKTDGTTAGTARVADLRPFLGSNPSELTVVGNTLYFVANDGTTGSELWALDTAPTSLPIITLAVSPSVVTENGSTNLVYTFTRTGATTSVLAVNVSVGGTASLANDFTQTGATSFSATSARVTFAAGAATAKVTIDPKGDPIIESHETVQLTLSPGSGYTIGSASAVTGTISNDDGIPALPPITTLIVVPSVVKEDGPSNLVYSFIRTGSISTALTINVKVGGSAAFGTDYIQTGAKTFSATAATVTFAAGSSTTAVTIDPIADSSIEPNETVELTLSPGPGYSIGATLTSTGTIVNDDRAFAIAPLASNKGEGRSGPTPFTFTVNRLGSAAAAGSVRWTVAGSGSNPTDAADFTGATSGTLSFAAGQASRRLTINVAGDHRQERDETFAVRLSTPTGAILGPTVVAAGTIRNDDQIGDQNPNTLRGGNLPDWVDGRGNGTTGDILTGGGAGDTFAFRFSESRLTAPDTITDFAFGVDRIDLFSPTGGALGAPRSISRAASNSTATTVGALAAAVFADANGALPGIQVLTANGAGLVQATNPAIAGTYLLINNATAGRSDQEDLLIKLGGSLPGLPPVGMVAVGTVFA